MQVKIDALTAAELYVLAGGGRGELHLRPSGA